MAADLLVNALARLPLFEGLSARQLCEIVRRAEHAVYHPGAIMIEENTEGDMAILVVSSGAMRVSGPELRSRMEPVPPGSLLGESAMLIDATTYGSTVVARSHVNTLRIRRDDLHAQMASDPTLADRLVQSLAGRLTRLSEQLREIDTILGGQENGPHALPIASKPPSSLPAPIH